MGNPLPRLDSVEFARARTRFYGASDNKAFVGWVCGATDRSIDVITHAGAQTQDEGRYIFQVFGSRFDALFCASLSENRPSQAQVNGEESILLLFNLTTPVRLESVVRSARRGTHGMIGILRLETSFEPVTASLQDVSYEGVGLTCDRDMRVSESGILEISTGWGEIALRFTAKNRKPIDSADGAMFRIGATVEPLDRLSAATWKKFTA